MPLAESVSLEDVPAEGAAALLAEEVVAGRCPLKNWDAPVEQWIARLNALAVWMPELGLPVIGPDDRRALIEQICYGATSYKAIKERAVWPVVRAWLSPQQERVDRAVRPRAHRVNDQPGPTQGKTPLPGGG